MKNKKILVIELLLVITALAFLAVRGINSNIKKEINKTNDAIVNELENVTDVLPTPEDAVKTSKEEKWELILVNPWNEIPEGYAEEIKPVYVEGYEVDPRIEEALVEMLKDCRDAGYSVQIISAFRDHATQEYLYNRTANKDDTAYPGTSEHECGLAVDIIDSSSAGWSDPLIEAQEELAGQIWLMENCHKYGFILRYPKDKEDITGIIYEPWHYRYVGKEAAAEMAAKLKEEGKWDICLEEYLGRIDNDKVKVKDR